METRENLQLRLTQMEGALASAVGDLQRAEAKIDHLCAALKWIADDPCTNVEAAAYARAALEGQG